MVDPEHRETRVSRRRSVHVGEVDQARRPDPLLLDPVEDRLEQGPGTTSWLEHAEVLAGPHKIVRRIELFLGRDLDLEAVAAVVEPALHRQRKDRLASAAG
jgi:hypothetical protein